jgi:hypothetical protein
MSYPFIFFIIIQVSALIYFVEQMRRILIRTREYNLKEDIHTMPFGFVRLRYVVVLYIISYLLWVVGSFFLYIYFVQSPPNGQIPGESMGGFQLNL